MEPQGEARVSQVPTRVCSSPFAPLIFPQLRPTPPRTDVSSHQACCRSRHPGPHPAHGNGGMGTESCRRGRSQPAVRGSAAQAKLAPSGSRGQELPQRSMKSCFRGEAGTHTSEAG